METELMVMTEYQCHNGCNHVVEDWVKNFKARKEWKTCPRCGKRASRYGVRTRHRMNAKTGEKRSAVAGCGFGEEAGMSADLAAKGIDAYYDSNNGDLVAADRKNFMRAIQARGLHSNTDGGFTH